MHATAQGFMLDILEDPSDDTPRLIFADYLDDEGDAERAEFIRVQCELESRAPIRAGESPSGHCARILQLKRREYELWRLHGFTFSTDLPGKAKAILPGCIVSCGIGNPIRYEFTRGFVHATTITVTDWIAHANALTAAQPIQQVTLTTFPSSDDALILFNRARKLYQSGLCGSDFSLGEGHYINAIWPDIEFIPPSRSGEVGNFSHMVGQ